MCHKVALKELPAVLTLRRAFSTEDAQFFRFFFPALSAREFFYLKRNPPAMPVVAGDREKALAAANVSIQKSSGVLN